MRTRAQSAQSMTLALATAALVATAGYGQTMSTGNIQYSAKVVMLRGQVSVLREAATVKLVTSGSSQHWALTVGDSVAAQQMIVTGPDGYALFQVSDGSTYEVFPNSKVVFRKNMPNWRDLIDVFLGQVRVHIQKLGNIPNPNRVITPTAVISVRGTTFDVTVDDEGESTLVQVEEGLVEVQHALMPTSGQGKLLRDGEEVRVFKQQPLAHGIDKGSVIQRVFHAMLDAVNTAIIQVRVPGRLPGGGGGCPACGSGDKGPPPPPPPPGLPN